MYRDLRFGARMLLKQPGFALVAVLTLALGIGATSAVFSLIQGVLLTPPPYREPHQLVLISPARTDGQRASRPQGWAAEQWLEWQREAKSLHGIAAYAWSFNFLVRPDGSESIEGMWVTREYFRVVGLQPLMGRVFSESETGAKPAPVIILGYDLWQRKFNGDPQIVGKTIHLSRQDTPPTVIGVMPPGVRFLPSPTNAQEPNYNLNAQVGFWMPAPINPERQKDQMWDVVGRLQGGRRRGRRGRTRGDLRQASEGRTGLRGDQAGRAIADRGIESRRQPHPAAAVGSGRAGAIDRVRERGGVTAGARFATTTEYAVRSALGVGRVALFRQVATESLVLAVLGGGLGIGLAIGVVKLFKLIGGHAIPRLDSVTTGWGCWVAEW